MELQEILEALPNLTPSEKVLIEKAYNLAKQVHKRQKRRSGEPYFTHCVAVAHILMDLRMDAATIAAALLHDSVEDTELTLEDIEKEFGEPFGKEVARLVDGVTKMKQLPTQAATDAQAEYLRKTFLTMGDDVRIVIIKLADRLHNMRTLGYHSPARQRAIAAETMDIFAPLANRLGIWQMKSELEDLAFRYLNPVAYRSRAKHIYSIYRKMQDRGLPFDEIHDIRAVRVIVDDVPSCYHVLGVVHTLWRPKEGKFHDYVAAPKDNFYQSLHTTVHDHQGKLLEVQIRTWEMHRNAEYGIAAHWRYKEGNKRESEAFERRINYLRSLMQFTDEDEVRDANDFIDTMKSEVFQDRVYAFTPKGDIIDLPAGATPVDFAYYIHTEIGHRCRGARVNGKLVGLDYRLRTGDRVEILAAKRGGPSLDWLSPHLGYTATTRARSKIRAWFRKQNRENNIAAGRNVLERELKRLGREDMSYDEVAALFKYTRTDDFLAAIGNGEINSGQLASQILEAERRAGRETLDRALRQLGRDDMSYDEVAALFEYKRAEDFLSAIGYGDITGEQVTERILAAEQAKAVDAAPQTLPVDASDGIEIIGSGSGLLVNLARCCNPTPGDPIVGYVTRGRGVTVHCSDCKNVVNASEPDRLIPVNWRRSPSAKTYPVPVMIVAYDREGLMRDIGAVIADEKINMSNVSITTKQNIATFLVTMEIADVTQLTRVLTKIERLPNVVEAHRRTTV